jgi:dTDP-4-dehydrorhamnose 3,5-epimerase
MFKNGTIHDVVVKDLARHDDGRGWLTEIYREDETAEQFRPAMQYISMTHAGVTRGPHEHVDQADYFAFIGPSTFKIYLWDGRKESPTHLTRQVITAGEGAPRVVIIPAGVVHAYKNVGDCPGMVLNLPNRLYAGRGKRERVDEIRHENDPQSPFAID